MIYDIYGTVVNQLITGKPTAQAGLSMAKLHAVPSPSEPAARCRWHRWWGLCCCNQDLPGSTIKIGKGHQDLKSKCEYIYIYYYILYIIIYYILLYTILYYILYYTVYIYISLSMKNSHSEVCSFQSWLSQVPRHSPHEFWSNDFGRPIFRRACRSNPTSYRPPPPSEAEKKKRDFRVQKKSLNECRNGMNDSLIT